MPEIPQDQSTHHIDFERPDWRIRQRRQKEFPDWKKTKAKTITGAKLDAAST